MRPGVRERDRTEKFPEAEIRKLAEMGCCGMLVPEEWGGAGMDCISYALMLEEVARVDAALATILGVTNSAMTLPLLSFGNDAQRKKYLTRLARGEWIGAFCLTEPQAGSDAAALQTRAVRDGGVYRLSGTKSWVSNGGAASLYLVFAKTDPEAGGKGITAFLVEPAFPGFRVARLEDKMGQRTSHSAEITLNDCVVPAENRLGEEGHGLKIALAT
ncbi:MAG TPA: acyl-CoA dehydrogenase family protein, partial [Candidatus Acidoferrum sp.]|nr:acyl-CoA dehydrogenase family protein [Candidatus Acidoferrum sp.]